MEKQVLKVCTDSAETSEQLCQSNTSHQTTQTLLDAASPLGNGVLQQSATDYDLCTQGLSPCTKHRMRFEQAGERAQAHQRNNQRVKLRAGRAPVPGCFAEVTCTTTSSLKRFNGSCLQPLVSSHDASYVLQRLEQFCRWLWRCQRDPRSQGRLAVDDQMQVVHSMQSQTLTL